MNIIEIEKCRKFDAYYHMHRHISNNDNKDKIKFLSKEDNKTLLNNIGKTSPTDLVELDSFDSAKLLSIAELILDGNIRNVPSDIAFMGTIPIMDMVIIMKRSDHNEKYRIVIFPDYQEKIRNSGFEEKIRIGSVVADFGDNDLVISNIDVCKGESSFIFEEKFGYKLPEFILDCITEDITDDKAKHLYSVILSIWYVIQLSCLYPVIKIFSNKPKTTVYETKETKSKNRKTRRKIKYIKKHIMNINDIDDTINKISTTSSGNYNRKTFCWYVTGHWRTYKSGKKVFIKPYWKGLLRESKNSEIRERELP